MPQYIVYARDHEPHSMPLRDEHREAHRRYILDNDVRIKLAGFMLDDAGNQCGSIYSFHAASKDEVCAFFAAEPYASAGVYADLQIHRWHPVLVRYDQAEWPQ